MKAPASIGDQNALAAKLGLMERIERPELQLKPEVQLRKEGAEVMQRRSPSDTEKADTEKAP